MGFWRRKKEPTHEDLANLERKTAIETHMATEPNYDQADQLGSMPSALAFDHRVVDDQHMKELFDSKLGYEWLQPLYPLFCNLNFLTNCSQREARLFRMKVKRAITRLKYRRKSLYDKTLLNSLEAFFDMRINDSVHGWKMDKLTTQRRYLAIEEQNKKKGMFR